MTSTSYLGSTTIVLQFDLSRNIDAAARDVQAAINAARGQLPANLPSNPTYRKVNPADAPILILALTSDTVDTGPHVRRGRVDPAAEALAGRRRRARCSSAAARCRRCAWSSTRRRSNNYGIGLDQVRTRARQRQRQPPQGRARRRDDDAGRSAPPTSCSRRRSTAR